ncbi:hypothetical protein LVJ94_03430 [Pendulispora rubella]|uniref:LVIVD repeat protein n=1 Tax=Pendulispora rubella TaxID=2741070 RepID=A0ABZ2LC15_9BACT
MHSRRNYRPSRPPGAVRRSSWVGGLAALTFVASVQAVLLPACGSDSSPSQPGNPDASRDAAPSQDGGGPPADSGQPDQASPLPDAGVARPHAGGVPTAIALVDHWAYITIGPRLTIWDVSAPSAPSLRGETPPFAAILNGVAVAGTFAYVSEATTEGDGLVRVIDVKDPATPTEVSSFHLGPSTTPEGAHGVTVIGKQLIIGGDTALWVFDLTDPRAPAPIRSIQGQAEHFRLLGKRLYYWSRTFTGGVYLGALDTSADLADLGAGFYTGALGADVAAGDLVIVTSGIGTQVFDAKNPSSPGSPLFESETQSRTLAALGPAAWVPAWDGLHVLDLSNPKSISDTGPIAMPSEGIRDAAILGNVLGVVTDRGKLLTIDVTEPRAPVSKAVVDISLCSECIGVQAAAGNLFLGAGSGGLRTGTVSDLKFLGSAYPGTLLAPVDFEGIAVEGNIAYVADWYGGGLRIYDVSDPTHPKQISQLAGGNYHAVAYAGGRVYLGQRTNGGVITVIDVSDPTHPTPLGSIETDQTWAITLRGSLAFETDNGGLTIFDVSNPASITTVGRYACPYGQGVALSGNMAAVACTDGFHFVDVSNPATPVKKSTWAPKWPGSSAAVAASGTRMYLGHSEGVTVVDLADPTAPKVLDRWRTSYDVRSLTLSAPDQLIATCGSGGVYKWSLSPK